MNQRDPDRHTLPREVRTRDFFPFRAGHPQLYDLRGTIYLHPDALAGLAWAAQHAPVRIRMTAWSQPWDVLHDTWEWCCLIKRPEHPDEWEIVFDPFEDPQ